ncbi:uncharacterized protein LOC108022521 [Drosophila biarmipes]|uniref:uncharacterized protein LOC108022521 n=1 Tax=Drosophila biarmipes TaxID=125945 RepID=UPI0007E7B690|nr:uncharacterized protein LOC108022521 [Drosophila biarmipes]
MLKVIFLIIFVLNPLPTDCGPSGKDTVCLDCRKYKKEKCRISKTGYQCQVSGSLRGGYLATILTPPVTSDMSVCIPEGMDIPAEHIDQCCVWSPKLGCQMLKSIIIMDHHCLRFLNYI